MPELVAVAPTAGQVVALDQVPDAVMAVGMLGPGLAIRPDADPAVQVVAAPVGGLLVRIYPHGAVIQAEAGTSFLLHLGVDTVDLTHAGFTALVEVGSQVDLGQGLITWQPSRVAAAGLATDVAVIVLQGDPTNLVPLAPSGHRIERLSPLFRWRVE